MPAAAPPPADLGDLLARVPELDAALLTRAHTIAERAHAGQPRRQGTPYIDHLVEVALILREQLGVTDPAILAAGLLHDAVEDSELTVDELVDFPERTRQLVALLTDPASAMTGAMRRAHYREIWKDRDATLLKAADRLSNIRDVVAHGGATSWGRGCRWRRTRSPGRCSGQPWRTPPAAFPAEPSGFDTVAPRLRACLV